MPLEQKVGVQSGTFSNFFAENDTVAQSEDHLTLTPTPTDSPNDPLNWGTWRKHWHAFLVLFIVGFTAATSNDISPAQYGMNDQLGISWAAMNTSSGILFLSIGFGTLLLYPIPALYGRRMVYIICLLSSIVGSIWLARTMNTQSALWNQLFIGASESCAEATAQLSLSDIYFRHQRGSVMGFYLLATSVGTYLGPLIAGFIADDTNWRWIGWWGLIFSFGTLIVFGFGLEETIFDRKTALRAMSRRAMPTSRPSLSAGSDDGPRSDGSAMDEKKVVSNVQPPDVQIGDLESNSEREKPFFRRIALITPAPNLRGTGFKQYMQRLWLIMRVFTFPAVWYSGLQWGAQDAWLTFYMTTEEDNWVGPPWNYSNNTDAIMEIPTLIGAVIGCVYGGWFSDYFMRWMARRNHGISEAEHRLWLVIPAGIISPAGLILFGIGTDKGWNWPWPYIGLGMIGLGWGCAGDLSMAYLEDAYPEIILEGMVGVSMINNIFACAFTFACGPWMTVQSQTQVYVEIGVISFVLMMSTIPMIYWGKACREWTGRSYETLVNIRDGQDGVQA